VASVAGGEEEEALWPLGSHAPEVTRGEQAWRREAGRRRQLADRRWKMKEVWASTARWATSPRLAGSIKKGRSLAGPAWYGERKGGGLHRGLGRK
jgi:hypothetical protein